MTSRNTAQAEAGTGAGGSDALAAAFVRFAVDAGALRFGSFRTKAGRDSPYFFNAGAFDDGAKLARLAEFYARRIVAAGLRVDALYGPAYKGIPLAATVAVALHALGQTVGVAYNRKEAKDHGEGGVLVGALRGRVAIVDDVISAGTSVRESLGVIETAGATPVAVVLALDRQERTAHDGVEGATSAVQDVTQRHGLQVLSIATLQDLLHHLQATADPALQRHAEPVRAYRQRYGV